MNNIYRGGAFMYYYGPSYSPGPMPYQVQPTYHNNNSVSFFSIILIVFLLLIIVGFFCGNNRGFGLC